MVTAIPATGTTIKLGSVYNAYYVPGATGAPPAGTVVTLSSTLGPAVGITAGTIIRLSENFGGRAAPNNYTPT